MVASEFLKARLTVELKHRVQAAAERQLMSESAWVRRLVLRELEAVDGRASDTSVSANSVAMEVSLKPWKDRPRRDSSRVYVRLRQDDRTLLDACAAARGMRPATYVSVVTRSHLRRLPPLPKVELLTLKRSVSELAAIGRNLNQIARVANGGGQLPSFARDEFRAMLKVCRALRDHTKTLLKANLSSWESGYGENV
ncbi:MAG: plasmid mobilization relaxosome protein MobC [Steroidobacteraceae bacterium]